MKRYTIGILMMFLFINISLAQTADTAVKSDELQTTTTSVDEVGVAPTDSTPTLSKKELRRQRVAKRNLHYNILGGPSYTPDFGLLIGGSALMTFRMNPSDTTQQRSVVPMAIALMFEGGLNLFTQALAKELAPSNIQVNAIACGVIDTRMNACFDAEERSELENEIPAGRFAAPSEVADFVQQLIDAPSYLTGQIISFDGGYL